MTREWVLALAPDDASAKAAAGLCSEIKWGLLGADAEAVWGECKGSGAKPYQTQVDLGAMTSKCSCPSRKFPCKHGLALLLLFAQGHARFSNAERPEWVAQWLESRRERAAKKEQAADAKPADPAALAAAAGKREAARWGRIEAGCSDLERWIADQFRRGLANCGAEQRREGEAMAARMVDAQAPALAKRLTEALQASAAGRHEQAIERLGLLQLICMAVARREQLAEERRADLRTALGWSFDRTEVLVQGEPLSDRWTVLGQCLDSDDKLIERRVWLYGHASGRFALLQDFSYGGQGWDSAWIDGACYSASLVFHPGSVRLRALVVSQGQSTGGQWPALQVAAMTDQASSWFARNPWLPAVPLLLDGCTPQFVEGQFQLATQAGLLPLQAGDEMGWLLLSLSGGAAVRMLGEWDGRVLRPLSMHAIAPEAQPVVPDRAEVAA